MSECDTVFVLFVNVNYSLLASLTLSKLAILPGKINPGSKHEEEEEDGKTQTNGKSNNKLSIKSCNGMIHDDDDDDIGGADC